MPRLTVVSPETHVCDLFQVIAKMAGGERGSAIALAIMSLPASLFANG